MSRPTLPPLQPRFGARSWLGKDLQSQPEQWRYTLSDSDIAELEEAVAAFDGSGRDLGTIDKASFPLSGFAKRLEALADTLVKGRGFELISGLPIERYDRQTAATIFCGIGAHLGSARSQNAMGHILGHVRDTGASSQNTNTRLYQTSERQTFHTDSADVVGLLCLHNAKQGGDSMLVSADAIFNRILETRPDLLPLLFDPIATDRRGEVPEGQKPFMDIPPFSWHQNELTVFYQRQYIDSAQRFPDAFRLTQAHIEVLDLFDACANDPELYLEMRLEPGDMQFVYNHSFLHDRTGFTDHPEPEKRRHLYRLWLSMPGDRTLPPSFAQRYGCIAVGDRGGIITKGTQLQAPVL